MAFQHRTIVSKEFFHAKVRSTEKLKKRHSFEHTMDKTNQNQPNTYSFITHSPKPDPIMSHD